MNLSTRLGFSKNSKLLIIHADDAGLSHSENIATIESLKMGMVNSYSIMVPCPWYYEMACFAKSNPEFDYGIHLTLTCEWEYYKFGPVLPISEVRSLVDENGHFYKKRENLKESASIEDVEKVGLNPEENIKDGDLLIEKAHFGIFDYFEFGKLGDYYANVFDNLVSGLNIILIHPAFNDNEMKGITVDHPNFGSEWRQIDFDSFTDQENISKLKKNNIELITWNDLKDIQ